MSKRVSSERRKWYRNLSTWNRVQSDQRWLLGAPALHSRLFIPTAGRKLHSWLRTASSSFFFKIFIYLSLSLPGLHCCAQAFSSCGEQGSLSSCGEQAFHCGGFSWGAQALGWVAVAHGLSCHMARGIRPKQEPNLCPLHRQADYLPLDHQGSPWDSFLMWIPKGPLPDPSLSLEGQNGMENEGWGQGLLPLKDKLWGKNGSPTFLMGK